MEGFYTPAELEQFMFKSCGKNVLISKKASLYQTELMSFGHDVRIDDFCILIGNITLGNYIHIAPYVGLHGSGGGEIVMRDFSGISANCQVYAGSDDYSGEKMTSPMVPAEYRIVSADKIIFEKYSLAGVGSVLLPGAVVAEGTAIGAMSLLSKPTEAWSIYVGIPCKRVKERKRGILEEEAKFLASLNSGGTGGSV